VSDVISPAFLCGVAEIYEWIRGGVTAIKNHMFRKGAASIQGRVRADWIVAFESIREAKTISRTRTDHIEAIRPAT
jgi:hypothetical protein